MQMEVTFPGGKKVDAQWQGYTIETDQSKKRGGDGELPAPFDLFLASIGTCVGIYVLNFCQERKIPTETINVVLDFHRDPETRLFDHIQIDINLPTEFPAKYIQAVKRAADLCAVKKHLHQPPNFDIQINVEK